MIQVFASLVVAVAAFAVSAAPFLGPDDPAFRVRVHTNQPGLLIAELDRMGVATDCGVQGDGNDLELILSENELAEVRRMGFDPIVLETARPFSEIVAERVGENPENPLAYMRYDEIVSWMESVAAAHPTIAEVVDLNARYETPRTHEGRAIYAMRISDNVQSDEDEPAMLLVSCHHAREIVTPVLAMDAITRLTDGYGLDPRVTSAVDNNEVWIIPVANPDGYEFVWTGNNFWRKNRRDNGGSIGVDTNRNYPQGWLSGCSGSTTGSSNTYKGPSAASEPETQTIMTLSRNRRFARVLDYHSSGRETLFGYRCTSHPFTSFYEEEARQLSIAHGYFGDRRSPSAEGEHYQWQFAHFGSLSFLTEVHTEFQPSFSSAQEEAVRVWPGVLHLLERPISVQGVTRNGGSPVTADVSLNGVTFFGGEDNSSGGPLAQYYWTLPAGSYVLDFAPVALAPRQEPLSVTGTSAVRLDIEFGSSCYADCDTSTGPGVLDLFDFLCFQGSFVAGEPYACDCDTSTGPGVCDLFDFLCFQDAFVAGCP